MRTGIAVLLLTVFGAGCHDGIVSPSPVEMPSQPQAVSPVAPCVSTDVVWSLDVDASGPYFSAKTALKPVIGRLERWDNTGQWVFVAEQFFSHYKVHFDQKYKLTGTWAGCPFTVEFTPRRNPSADPEVPSVPQQPVTPVAPDPTVPTPAVDPVPPVVPPGPAPKFRSEACAHQLFVPGVSWSWAVSAPDGDYAIRVSTSDGYHAQGYQPEQTEESLAVMVNGVFVGSTPDIPEAETQTSAEFAWSGSVGTITLDHKGAGPYNSVHQACVVVAQK